MISVDEVAVVAAAVVARLPDQWLTRSPLVTVEEAMAYSRTTSRSSWGRFCARHKLKRASGNNYERQAVERAVEAEIRLSRKIKS